MVCPVCGGNRIYEGIDILQCQDCGKREVKRDFYAIEIECGECGSASLRLGVAGSKCPLCGNEKVNVKTVTSDGCAIIEEEKEAKKKNEKIT